MLSDKEKRAIYRKRYNDSEKGKLSNKNQSIRYRANPNNRHKCRMRDWKKRGLKYYPIDIHEQYETKQNCYFCSKELKKNWMEHNHTTGQFRGFTCSSCNTNLAYTDKYFRMLMKELKFIFSLPNIIKNLTNIKCS